MKVITKIHFEFDVRGKWNEKAQCFDRIFKKFGRQIFSSKMHKVGIVNTSSPEHRPVYRYWSLTRSCLLEAGFQFSTAEKANTFSKCLTNFKWNFTKEKRLEFVEQNEAAINFCIETFLNFNPIEKTEFDNFNYLGLYHTNLIIEQERIKKKF